MAKCALEPESFTEVTKYHSLAIVWQNLTITRPDLSYVNNYMCQHMYAPRITHLFALN